MKPAAKGKASQLDRSRSSHRAPGPTTSYLKTRVRGSRLFEVALILAIAELTRRLHQAYGLAYDQQAADKVLPQNYVPPTIKDLKDSFYKKYKSDLDRCIKKVFGFDYVYAFGFGATETNKTSPSVNLSKNSKQLGKMTGVPAANGAPDGPNHAIYIASDAWRDPANALSISDKLYRIYGHELGNEVSFDISGSYTKFGYRKGIGASYKDKDSGAKFEECIFGNVHF